MKHTKLHIVPLALLAFGSSLQAQGQVLRFPDGAVAAAAIADLDGDGRRELLITQTTPQQDAEVRLFRGVDGQLLRSHLEPFGSDYGATLAALDDINGDGVGDYAIAAPAFNSSAPTYVEFRSGANGAVLSSFGSQGLPEAIGVALASVADVDLDGVDDLLIAARARGIGQPSRVYLVSPPSGVVLRTHFAASGNDHYFGIALARLDDVDGDGIADYAITNNGAANPLTIDPDTLPTLEVFSGANGGLIYRVVASLFEFAGSAIVNLGGDLDGDGIEDFAVGVPGRIHQFFPSAHTGGVDVRSGANGALIRSAAAGFGVALGQQLAALGDINGNGSPDFASNSIQLCPTLCEPQGYTHFFDGSTGATIGLSAFGSSSVLAAAGDLNFDGRGDLIVSRRTEIVVLLGGVRPPLAYCPSFPNSSGCFSTARVEGSASASIGPELQLVAPNLRPQRVGLFFWGTASTAVPFGPGTMCVAAPRVRLPLASTGGASGCSGELRTTLSRTYLAANGLLPGSVFFAQAWARDNGSPSQPTQLSSALEVTLWP